ncbi:MAG: hypothetical protein SV760_04365, partial [Halobacteria archaeon]|nr:hypothetical protein [Halobacteria archaeon]
KVSDEPLIEFLNDISAQTVEMWQDSDGMQYLRCKKSPRGKPGDSRVIDYVDEKPYVKLL